MRNVLFTALGITKRLSESRLIFINFSTKGKISFKSTNFYSMGYFLLDEKAFFGLMKNIILFLPLIPIDNCIKLSTKKFIVYFGGGILFYLIDLCV